MKFRREITLTADNITNIIVEDSRDILRKSGFSEAETDIYVEQIVGILEDYAECFGEGAEVEYLFSKRLLKAEFRFLIPGKPFDPFIEGNSALKRSYNKMYSLNLGIILGDGKVMLFCLLVTLESIIKMLMHMDLFNGIQPVNTLMAVKVIQAMPQIFLTGKAVLLMVQHS